MTSHHYNPSNRQEIEQNMAYWEMIRSELKNELSPEQWRKYHHAKRVYIDAHTPRREPKLDFHKIRRANDEGVVI